MGSIIFLQGWGGKKVEHLSHNPPPIEGLLV